MSQLPPQSPDDYPYLSNAARAPAGGAHCSKTFSPSDSGLVQPGPSVSGLSAGMNHPGVQIHPGAGHPLAGYPRGALEPFPYSQASYPQVMMLPPPRAFWDGLESAMRRKRTTNRRVRLPVGLLGCSPRLLSWSSMSSSCWTWQDTILIQVGSCSSSPSSVSLLVGRAASCWLLWPSCWRLLGNRRFNPMAGPRPSGRHQCSWQPAAYWELQSACSLSWCSVVYF